MSWVETPAYPRAAGTPEHLRTPVGRIREEEECIVCCLSPKTLQDRAAARGTRFNCGPYSTLMRTTLIQYFSLATYLHSKPHNELVGRAAAPRMWDSFQAIQYSALMRRWTRTSMRRSRPCCYTADVACVPGPVCPVLDSDADAEETRRARAKHAHEAARGTRRPWDWDCEAHHPRSQSFSPSPFLFRPSTPFLPSRLSMNEDVTQRLAGLSRLTRAQINALIRWCIVVARIGREETRLGGQRG
ncbi:hypothetical protein B0H12DRAFT_380945 [Mycena haematopus]|nr:hypothetical protein B0H12DRAFT_380945 [Mycena haematopus]